MKNLLLQLLKQNKKVLSITLALVLGITSVTPGIAVALEESGDGGQPRGNIYIDKYMEANWDAQLARGIPYPSRTKPMILYGSWYNMGKQYGKNSGKYIRIVYDGFYGLWLNSGLPPEKLGMVLDKYQDEAKKLSPEMVEFARGISEGAKNELNGADHAAALTNMQKIMLINSPFEVVFPTAWAHVAELMNVPAPAATAVDWEPFNSHTWAVRGDMTTRGQSMIGGTRDQPWLPTLYNVSYVAIPSDRRAAVTWSNTIAGFVVASAQVNEHGVGMGNTIVDAKKQEFGVPAIFTTAHISFFARSAQEAADIYTVGTPKYRQKTGRKTLASTTGFFQTFADPKEAIIVERTGRNYAIRKTGDQGEKGDYVVLPNHALAANSYDEQGNLTGKPMEDWTIPSGPDSSTRSRYWALFYEFEKNKGKVNPLFAQEVIAPLKHTYTPEGQLVTEKDGIPVWRLGLTPERWIIPNPADPNSFPVGGNNMYFVADLKQRDIYWVQGIPSHWSGKWEHTSLRGWDWLRR